MVAEHVQSEFALLLKAVEMGAKPVQGTGFQQSGGGPGRGCWGVSLGLRHCPGLLSECLGPCSSCLSMRDGAQLLVTRPGGKRGETLCISMVLGVAILRRNVQRSYEEEAWGGYCSSTLNAELELCVQMRVKVGAK